MIVIKYLFRILQKLRTSSTGEFLHIRYIAGDCAALYKIRSVVLSSVQIFTTNVFVDMSEYFVLENVIRWTKNRQYEGF